jgi:hypothetical protein
VASWQNPSPKFQNTKFHWKFSRLDFLGDQDDIVYFDCLPNGQPINAVYYLSLPVQLKRILKEKCLGKFNKCVVFIHNKAPAHRALATQKKLAYLGFHCLNHQPYSWYLAPSETICSLD